jgi:FMN phosphatase YigB (HAD superfamily)
VQDLRRIDAVIFDLGGVLMKNGRPRDAADRFPGADPQLVMETLMGPFGLDTDHPWHRLERGEITFAECRAANRAALGALGLAVWPEPARTNTNDPERSGNRATGSTTEALVWLANEAMMALVHDLRAAGLRTGMLTNNVREFRPMWWAVADWHSMFDDIVDSHEVGIRKPNPAIYELAMARLGVSAGRTAFLDDLEHNVEAASARGMHGVLVEDLGSTAIAAVRTLAGLEA